jgi:hypothetical protein
MIRQPSQGYQKKMSGIFSPTLMAMMGTKNGT